MIQGNKTRLALAIAGTLSLAHADTVQLRIIETADLHANMMDFNYYRDKASAKIGLVRAATLVKQAEQAVKNSLLVDNGDLIQGSPMGDYMADKGIKAGEVHPVYKAMNLLNYEVGNIGNHEFNYGLDFLKESINDAKFPYISANVFDAKTGEPYFTPYLIKNYTLTGEDGKTHEVKVGYIGFVPPQIMTWDKRNLEGKVTAKDITEMAKKYVPEMKEKGADVVIAIPHSGLSSKPQVALAENSSYYLSKVDGIDAIAFGHAHAVFPSERFADIDGVDVKKGTINGIASVMPGRWGDHVGIIDLTLDNASDKWTVTDGTAKAMPIYDKKGKTSLAEADEALRKVLAEDHKNTRAFVNQPIGKSNAPMKSFLALVQDDPTIQIVNLAQKDYVERFVQGDPDLADLPVISAAAPFKAGGRKNDPNNFTEVEAGELTFSNAADLYLYPNTLVALKLTGAEVKDWLECSAGQFNQIDPNSTEKQQLINWAGFPTYNFDVMDGVTYQIDVTQPARYDRDCKVVNAGASRIVNLQYNGKAIDEKQAFLVATNNYRAYGGKFAGTDKAHLAFAAPDENRSVLADYIRRVSKEQGEIKPSADGNWTFKPIEGGEKLNVIFETSPSDNAKAFIKEKSRYTVKEMGTDEDGFAVYQIDLSK